MSGKKQIVVTPTKSMVTSIILTIFFGPFGIFYSSFAGALILVTLLLIIGFFSMGTGLIVMWPCAVVWGILKVNSHNQKIIRRADCRERLYSVLYG